MRRRQRARVSVAELLEARRLLVAPAVPVIIEPFTDGQVTGTDRR